MPQDPSVQDLIRQESQRQGVPPELSLAVAQQESSFNPTATGPKLPSGESAVGTFQLLPSTAKTLGVDPTNPRENIRGGVTYLRQLLDKHQGDLGKVLSEYGGVKTDQTYVPGVLAKIPAFKNTGPPPTPAVSHLTSPPPAPTTTTGRILAAGGDLLRAFDPRTEAGRRNLAGGAGAAALTAAAPELGFPSLLARAYAVGVPIAGAFAGGAAEAGLEHGGDPTVMAGAGGQQAGQEALGQVAAWPIKAVGRRVAATSIGKSVSQGLSDALEAVKTRLSSTRSPVTPAQAGQLVEDVAQGPAKTVKDQLGKAVETAAQSGPDVPLAPIKDKLQALAQQIRPVASHDTPASQVVGGVTMPGDKVAALAKAHPEMGLSTLPPDHPLPGALAQANSLLGDGDTAPFSEVHKAKRLLDDAINYNSPVKKQVQGITQAARGAIRESLSGHEPYNEANAAYAPIAKLYEKGLIPKLHKGIIDNPEGLVNRLDWNQPTQAKLVRDLTVGYGGDQGEAAWNATQASWTNENLIAKGPSGMIKEMRRMEASGNGQDFIQTMYGDPTGQMVWTNLKQIGGALEKVQADQQAFRASSLGRAESVPSLGRDAALSLMPGHSVFKIGAASRLIFGPDVKELIQWASYAPERTQFLINHVLTGPDPGMMLANAARWYTDSGGTESPDQGGPPPTPRSAQSPQGPPVPQALAR